MRLRILLIAPIAATLVACASKPLAPPSASSAPTTATAAKISPATTSVAKAAPVQQAKKPEEYDDLWDRVRIGLAMQTPDSPLVERHIKWFQKHPKYLELLVKRARLYLYHIVVEVEKREMPLEIALLPAIESAYKPHALSHARAAGLWQFIPSTGRHFGLARNWWYDGRRDVVAATKAALDYLEQLHERFDGDWHLALASYNAGERRVERAVAKSKRKGDTGRYEELHSLKAETKNYVPKLIAFAHIVANPQKYGLKLDPIPNKPYFAHVEIGSQIDLGVVARLANISIGDLYDINPGFKRWATSPDGPHRILIPAERRERLLAALRELPEGKRVRWLHHRVRQGETLSHIGERYRVSVAAIRHGNRMRNNRIRIGQDLIIPVSLRGLNASQHANITRPSLRPIRGAAVPKNAVRVTHRVMKGDTLWTISRRYNIYIYQITGWNGISRRRPLRPGQRLKIYLPPARAAELGFTPANS